MTQIKWLGKLRLRLEGLTDSVSRYPVTAAFLAAAAILVAVRIQIHTDYTKYIWTCAVGAVLGAAAQMIWERFFRGQPSRLLFMGAAAAIAAGYYLIIRSVPPRSMELEIRTSVALFALLMAFIWVPSIKSRVTFNESFMVVFKSFFQSVFYSAVIFGGISIVTGAIDQLIVRVDPRAYSHIANIVFTLFAPIFFLSMIPVYPGKEEVRAQGPDETIDRASYCPKFLEVLISNIIIPLTGVFTVILLIYIARNIGGPFWTNNLLEPMLVSYAITVILVYILASRLNNKFAVLFLRIFPKVLVPIVLFQIVSSLLRTQDAGITHPRYFVILFGLFAACAGVVFSLLPVRKNGIVAAMLIVFCALSIIPPADAFTISRISQTSLLEKVLTQNGMLKNNVIVPNGSLSDGDKKKIAQSVDYLGMMGYTQDIAWLPADFTVYEDFYNTFGFNRYDLPDSNNQRYVNVVIDPEAAIDIAGYDILTHAYINPAEDTSRTLAGEMENAGKKYSLTAQKEKEGTFIILADENKQELIRFDTGEIFSRYQNFASEKSQISGREATFVTENDRVKLSVVVRNASISTGPDQTYYNGEVMILTDFK